METIKKMKEQSEESISKRQNEVLKYQKTIQKLLTSNEFLRSEKDVKYSLYFSVLTDIDGKPVTNEIVFHDYIFETKETPSKDQFENNTNVKGDIYKCINTLYSLGESKLIDCFIGYLAVYAIPAFVCNSYIRPFNIDLCLKSIAQRKRIGRK